jgi:hypothetical protein
MDVAQKILDAALRLRQQQAATVTVSGGKTSAK